jgi:glycosyltransferase involved in cell wall biosynthesis
MADALEMNVPARNPVATSARPRVAILANVIAPYQKPVLDQLSALYPGLRILLSTPMETNRPWKLEWAGLDVIVQKTITLNRRWRHPKGFSEPLFVHFPLDTFAQLARFRPDLVISWEMGARSILAAAYARTHGAKLMLWAEFAESTEYGRGTLRQIIRRVLHRAVDGFLVTGASGARYLASLAIPQHKVHQIVYTTNVQHFLAASSERTAATRTRLLYVGQLIERKGLVSFLEILARWAAAHTGREIEFIFAGDGPLRERLTRFVLPPNVQLSFTGNLAYDELPRVYANADIFVLPTLADTWGVVVNEAMASGLPVLGSSYAQAVSELVEEGKSGWTFRPDTPDEVLAAMDRALTTSRSEWQRIGEHARQTALRLTPEYAAGLIARAIASCTAETEGTP